jgi:hypothetical protein
MVLKSWSKKEKGQGRETDRASMGSKENEKDRSVRKKENHWIPSQMIPVK